jgi:hypothetical protein
MDWADGSGFPRNAPINVIQLRKVGLEQALVNAWVKSPSLGSEIGVEI